MMGGKTIGSELLLLLLLLAVGRDIDWDYFLSPLLLLLLSDFPLG